MAIEPLNCAIKSWITYDNGQKGLQQIEEEAMKDGLDVISFQSKREHNFGEIVLMIRGGKGLIFFPRHTLFCQY